MVSVVVVVVVVDVVVEVVVVVVVEVVVDVVVVGKSTLIVVANVVADCGKVITYGSSDDSEISWSSFSASGSNVSSYKKIFISGFLAATRLKVLHK